MTNNEKESMNLLEVLGLVVAIICIFAMLCVPGAIIADNKKADYMEEAINQLCNKSDGKYDFCQLTKTVKIYKYKDSKND